VTRYVILLGLPPNSHLSVHRRDHGVQHGLPLDRFPSELDIVVHDNVGERLFHGLGGVPPPRTGMPSISEGEPRQRGRGERLSLLGCLVLLLLIRGVHPLKFTREAERVEAPRVLVVFRVGVDVLRGEGHAHALSDCDAVSLGKLITPSPVNLAE
jgi:hypothetical protein